MFIAACAVSLLAGLSSAHATPARVEALQQVNRDIWEPFTRGVATFDDPAWLGVRSRDFVMVQQGKPLLIVAVGGMVLILALGVFLPLWDMAANGGGFG